MQKLPPPRVTTPDMRTRFPIEQLTGLSLVLALHAAALYGLWSARLIPSPADTATLFVNFIAPPQVKKADEPNRPPAPKPRAIEPPPQTRQLVAETPATTPTDYVAPPPPPKPEPIQAPVAAVPVIQAQLPVGPAILTGSRQTTPTRSSHPRRPACALREGGASDGPGRQGGVGAHWVCIRAPVMQSQNF